MDDGMLRLAQGYEHDRCMMEAGMLVGNESGRIRRELVELINARWRDHRRTKNIAAPLMWMNSDAWRYQETTGSTFVVKSIPIGYVIRRRPMKGAHFVTKHDVTVRVVVLSTTSHTDPTDDETLVEIVNYGDRVRAFLPEDCTDLVPFFRWFTSYLFGGVMNSHLWHLPFPVRTSKCKNARAFTYRHLLGPNWIYAMMAINRVGGLFKDGLMDWLDRHDPQVLWRQHYSEYVRVFERIDLQYQTLWMLREDDLLENAEACAIDTVPRCHAAECEIEPDIDLTLPCTLVDNLQLDFIKCGIPSRMRNLKRKVRREIDCHVKIKFYDAPILED
jgi:hypothetical protein